jgi:hypothetical protein
MLIDAEPTARKQIGRPFQPGQSGNPLGRPVGARQKLGTAFVEALESDFLQHGVAAIQAVREKRPHDYLKVIASLLPRNVELSGDLHQTLTLELGEFVRDYRLVRLAQKAIGVAEPLLIEADDDE